MTNAPAERTDPAQSDYLGLVAAGERFGIAVSAVREIRIWSEPTALPWQAPALLGVINLRGAVLPVIDLGRRLDLDRRLGLGQTPAPGARGLGPRPVIVVLEAGGRQVGIAVERVEDIVTIPDAGLEPPPATGSSPAGACLSALALRDDGLLRILDAGALMLADRGAPS